VLTPAEQTRKHKMAAVAPPYVPDGVVPAPHLCPGQRFTISLDWLKGLGSGLGHTVWQAIELYRNLEEEARTL
jgi:hypothetical protein